MPSAPPRLCSCGRIVTGGRCPTCSGRRPRGTANQRGYDAAWQRLAARHRADHPLCVRCQARGIVRPMRHVDHVVPFTSIDDPRRLDPSNLQSLCKRCHDEKTNAEQRRAP